MPTATREQADELRAATHGRFAGLQRALPGDHTRVRRPASVTPVRTPTLVIHVRDEVNVPITLGRELAAGIPNARFVALPGRNHVLLEQDPGVAQFLKELKSFVSSSS